MQQKKCEDDVLTELGIYPSKFKPNQYAALVAVFGDIPHNKRGDPHTLKHAMGVARSTIERFERMEIEKNVGTDPRCANAVLEDAYAIQRCINALIETAEKGTALGKGLSGLRN